MKKSRLFQIFLLLIIFVTFVTILAGCGGGGGGGNGNLPPSTIQFWTSGMYQADDGVYYGIPTNAKVQFYTLTEATYNNVINEADPAPIEADHVFTGNTENNDKNIVVNLPDHLKNQERYIFAVVATGNISYDLKGKTIAEAKNDAANGEILFGQTTSPCKLTSGGVINIKFEGKAEGDRVKTFYFTMADTYIAGESELPIPTDKAVTFYCVTDDIGNTFSSNAVMFHGTTSSTNKTIEARLPDTLEYRECYFYAVVNLDGFYDLRGKTMDDVIKAIYNGKMLFGQSMNPMDPNEKRKYTLKENIYIDNFVFHGPTPDGVINFVMPEKCGSGTPIPPGKTVKFYALKSTEKEPLNADEVFTWTTGSNNIQCTLPGRLIGQDYYFFAVVNISGSFDLQGKTKLALSNAVSRGEVFFGQSKEPPELNNNKLYTLTNGITIDNFVFIDAVAQEDSKIKFTIPDKYKGPPSQPGADDGEEFDIPVGKRIKFYAITYDAYESATGGTTTINGELIHEGTTGGSNIYTADLPDHLIDQERYFLALIVLSETEDYDLSRMTTGDLQSAMLAGKVLYGRHLISGQGDIELVEIVSGINEIDNFEFMGGEP